MTNFIVNQATDDGTGLITGTLSYAILQANQLAGDDTITINSDVRVTGVMKTLVNSNITIVGNNHSLSGDANGNNINDNGDVRPLFILSGTVGISNLTITNGRAKGGDSTTGGGGAGLGGGLFIYDGNVSLTNVAFSNNAAQGGSSGVGGLGNGGGGMFGNGGSNSGGGLFGNAGSGYSGGYGGNGNYGGYGGYSGSGYYDPGKPNGGFGGGGILNGGFGGGAGFGSGTQGFTGGFGGGGGFSNRFSLSFSPVFGGNGGYGAGGGSSNGSGGFSSGGLGGFGGGNGNSSSNGGGGAGLGGSIFVRSGSLSLNNTSFIGNTATGGTGANSGQGLGGAIFIMQSTTNTNGNNQGMPTVLGTINFVGSSTFSGNSAANDAGTLTNNDDVYGTQIPVTTPTVSITAQTATATEGGSNGVYRLTRTDTTGDLTINLTLDGSSTASTADYTLSGGSVTVSGSTLTATIAAGQSFVDINLAAFDDIAAEPDETLKLNLATGTGYTVDGTNNTATVTIAANDTVVTNTNDSGEGSLRQAILNANAFAGADTITFAGSVFTDATPDTITLTSGQLVITDALTINGLGASNLSISGNNSSAVFKVDDGNSSNQIAVAIGGLTITAGKDNSAGGGIFNRENLTLSNNTISNNTGNFGGIYNESTLSLTGSTVSNNTGNFTGGIVNFGTLSLTGSTVSGNTGVNYGGITNQGILLSLTNSTVSSNTTTGIGGAGGIGNSSGTLSLINSTVSGNTSAGNSGGIANLSTANLTNSTISGNRAAENGGGILNIGTLNLNNSTITNNTADSDNNSTGDGGGISVLAGTATAKNTIIAGNFDSGNQAPDIKGALTGNANNLIGSLTGASGSIGTGSDITFASAGITNINQVIGSLTNNGGATQTHAIISGSAAINAGDNTLIPSGVTTDQRGITRTIGSTVDIGAYESPFIPPVAANDTATTDENTAVNINVLGNDTDANGDSLSVIKVNGNSVTVGTPITLASGALLTLNANGTFNYNPNSQFESLGAGATANDSFTYTASDNGNGGTSTATVNLTINGVNDTATITGTATAAVTEDTATPNLTATGSLTVSDVDAGQNIFNTTVTPATGNLGSLSITNAGAYSYSVANSAVQFLGAGQTKAETFTVNSVDGTASQNIIVTINGVNDTATITGTATAAVTEDATTPNLTATGSLTVSDADAGQNIFNTTVTPAIGNLGSLSITSAGAYSYSVANSAVQFLGAGQTKAETFTVTSVDGTASQNIIVTINGVNDTATITGVATAAVTEDTATPNLTATGSLTVSDVDAGQNIFNTTVTSATGNLGSLSITNAGAYSYSVANSAVQFLGAGQTKAETFTVSSVDGTASRNIIVTINGVNDAATITGTATAAVTEDATTPNLTATGSLTVSDADAGQNIFNTTVTSATGNLGSLSITNAGAYSYSVANSAVQFLGAGQTKAETFTVTSVDGTASKNITVTINGVNDAPTVANALPDKTTIENSGFNFTVPANTFADVDTSNTLTYTATLDNGNPLPSWLTFNATTRIFSGTPVAANVGTISVKVTAKDNSNATVSDIFNLAVTPLNLTGTPNADTLTGTASNNTINGLAGNDTITGNKGNDTITGGSGQDRFVYNLGDGVDTITDFGGVGQGVNPSAAVIAATDTLKFQGAGLTAQNLLLTKNGSNLEVSFENIANSPKVILQNFALENLDNLRKVNGASVDLGNILFNGQTTIQNDFDIFDANSTLTSVFRENIVTFLNDNNNTVDGFNNSNDVINAQGGNDRIDGKSGNDLLRGGAGNDTLIGGSGNDILIGGADNDSLTGGSGNDQFVYQAFSDKGTTGDTITDFNKNDDKLVLTDLFKSLSYSGTNPISDGYLRFVQSGTSTRVQIDANGGADALSTLTTLNNFTATNLVIGSNVLV